MREKNNDTVLLFKNTLMKLLENIPLENITVNDILRESELGRTTFYNYYDDIFSLYSDLIEENVAPFDQFFRCIKDRENQLQSSHNFGAIFDVISKNRRFYCILFKSNEPYFLYRLRKAVSSSMRSVSDIPFPNYCYIVFADRFICILRSLILDEIWFKGEWLVHTCAIWLDCCGEEGLLNDVTLKVQYKNAIVDLDKYEKKLRLSFDDSQCGMDARIKISFLRLIRSKPFWNIRVIDIVNDAGISRSSFYKFYQGVDALYDKVCDDVMGVLRKMFREHGGSYYEIICKISDLINRNKDIVDPLLSCSNSKPFSDLFVSYMIYIQKYYFGLDDRENLHDNVARTFLDVYEIFSHDEMDAYGCYENIIYGRCLAVAETFKFNGELDSSHEMEGENVL